MPHLIVTVEGVEVKNVYLHKDRTTLGRKTHNDIVLDNLAVSGEHCVFELKGLADVYVQDLGSTNGTFVNNRKVQRQQLRDGDVLSIGRFRIHYQAESEPPSSRFGATAALSLESMSDTVQRHARLKVLTGSSAGLEIPVVKAVTTFGKPGVSVVSIAHRRNGYFIALLEGAMRPLLNDQPIGEDPEPLTNHDVVEIAGTRLLFLVEPPSQA